MTLPRVSEHLTLPERGLSPAERDHVAALLLEIALSAGPTVLHCYTHGCEVSAKADTSPVTEADERAEAIILEALSRCLAGVPVVAEETVSRAGAPACGGRFILVDPVDGTREFLERTGEFTINIALVEDGVPVAGAIYAPTLGLGWCGGATATAAVITQTHADHRVGEMRSIRARAAPATGLTAYASRSHANRQTQTMLDRIGVRKQVQIGSSLKFCRLAEGEGDVYPRMGTTMEWDTAAGDAILRAAGGAVLGMDGRPLHYGKENLQFRNPDFIAWGDRSAGMAFALAESIP